MAAGASAAVTEWGLAQARARYLDFDAERNRAAVIGMPEF